MKALIIEDDFLVARIIQMTLDDMGIEVCGIAESAEEAIALSRTERPDLVVADFALHGRGTGVDAVQAIRDERRIKVVYITGDAARVKQLEPAALVVSKPFNPVALKATIQRVLL